MKPLPKFTLVLGGANSGKSLYAETLARQAGLPVTYLATAEARDAEMAAKIAAHKARREGLGWGVIEAPLDLAPAREREGLILLDCLTMWISNHMEAGNDLPNLSARFLEFCTGVSGPIIAVSNEVGLGGIAATAEAREFARLQGALNQALAEKADLVAFVAAGLPLALKGNLP